MEFEFESLQELIRRRRTDKVLGDPCDPVCYSQDQLERGDEFVRRAIQTSGNAPFHFDRRSDGLAEPWRIYMIGREACLRLADMIPKRVTDLKPGNKLPGLLSACGSLTLFTWLPEPVDGARPDSRTERINREHLAATSAAIQNFLLLLTSASIGSYWSSGNLIEEHFFKDLNICETEILAAAVFASYLDLGSDTPANAMVVGGKQRPKRCGQARWFSEIGLSDQTEPEFVRIRNDSVG